MPPLGPPPRGRTDFLPCWGWRIRMQPPAVAPSIPWLIDAHHHHHHPSRDNRRSRRGWPHGAARRTGRREMRCVDEFPEWQPPPAALPRRRDGVHMSPAIRPSLRVLIFPFPLNTNMDMATGRRRTEGIATCKLPKNGAVMCPSIFSRPSRSPLSEVYRTYRSAHGHENGRGSAGRRGASLAPGWQNLGTTVDSRLSTRDELAN